MLSILSFHARMPKKNHYLWPKLHGISLRALSTFSKVVCLTKGLREGKKREHFYVQKRETKQTTSSYQEMENFASLDEPLRQPHSQIHITQTHQPLL